MKYYICEGKSNEWFNAATKARDDVKAILNDSGYNPFVIETKSGIQKNKLMKVYQVFVYFQNYIKWKKSTKKLVESDEIVVEYPIIHTTLFYNKIVRKLNKRNIKTTVLIHDLNSLRYINMPRVRLEDTKVLKEFSKVISHNESMTKYLLGLDVPKEKMVNLEIFDYLAKTDTDKKYIDGVIIAGNLAPEKAAYITKLNKIRDVQFLLYGIGYVQNEEDTNIDYRGAFKADEIVHKLEGKFGLVWDGTSIEECNGIYGEYLKYNNPHKASLYMSSGIPVIVWKKSALASFVIENQVGIVVDNLTELNEILNNISDEEYNDMIKNVKKIQFDLQQGNFLKQAINKEIN